MASITDTGDIGRLTESEHRAHLTRAVIASAIGTTIEWYDFFLYSTVTGLVFGPLFFPGANPTVSTLNAFGVYGVGFLARPVGAAIFGHYGDQIGRKSTLIATLLLMGIATFLVAFVPSYASAGIWGGILLTLLRVIQGVGVGGEWGGSVLLAMEWAKTNNRRGFIASWPQFGVPAGLLLANIAVLVASRLSGDKFLDWGWRIPFLISILLVAIGFWIRIGILETPTFRRLVAGNRIEKAPLREVLRLQPWQVVQSAFVRMAEQAPFYLFTAFVFSYCTSTLGFQRDFVLNAVLAAALVSIVSIPFFGYLSDRIGRKTMYMIGAVLVGLYGFAYFTLLDTKSPTLAFVAIMLSILPHAMMYGPQAALIAELFTGRLRYTGASLGYQLASIIAGGPAPLIALWLLSTYHSGYAIAGFIAACSVISLIATSFVKDYTGKDIALEYDD
jgi:metabolite-proton symporter